MVAIHWTRNRDVSGCYHLTNLLQIPKKVKKYRELKKKKIRCIQKIYLKNYKTNNTSKLHFFPKFLSSTCENMGESITNIETRDVVLLLLLYYFQMLSAAGAERTTNLKFRAFW